MTTPEDRLKALGILDIAVATGAWPTGVADLLGVGLFTLQRWRRQFAGDGDGLDGRKGSPRQVYHRLTDEERHRILLTCNQPEFAALRPGQIVPVLADRGLYNSFGEDCVYGSERSFHRVLHAQGQVHRRGQARPPQEPRPVRRLALLVSGLCMMASAGSAINCYNSNPTYDVNNSAMKSFHIVVLVIGLIQVLLALFSMFNSGVKSGVLPSPVRGFNGLQSRH